MSILERLVWSAVCAVLAAQPVCAENLNEWQYRRNIYLNTTASGANVAASVDNFPVLVRLGGSEFPAQAVSGGDDVRFTDAGGAQLSYEIERWDDTKDSADIWVLAPTVEGSDSTQLRMFWGKTGVSPKSNGAAVFQKDNGFRLVSHLNSNASLKDASGVHPDGTNHGADNASGAADGGQNFVNGTNDYISFPHSDSLDADVLWEHPKGFSYSWWMYPHDDLDTTTRRRTIAAKGVSSGGTDRQEWLVSIFGGGNSGALTLEGYAGGWKTAQWDPGVWDANTWYHIAAVYNLSTVQYYVNGAASGSPVAFNYAFTSFGDSPVTTLAHHHTSSVEDSVTFDGVLDEFRVCAAQRSGDWIRLCFMNQRPTGQELVDLGPALGPEDFAADWSRHNEIILNTSPSGADVSGEVCNFPVLVRLTSAQTNVYSAALDHGQDIRFTKADGVTPLFHEIERWSEGGASEIWVLVDTIRAASSTQKIIMHYGNPSAASRSDGALVFQTASDFAGVWHLDEAASGPGATLDRTSNGNDGTPTNMEGGDTAAAVIGNGYELDGGNEYVDLQSPATLDNLIAFTYSAWIYPQTYPSDYNSILTKGVGTTGSTTEKRFLVNSGGSCSGGDLSTDGCLEMTVNCGGADAGAFSVAGTVPLSSWSYVTVTYTTADGPRLYKNGAEVTYSGTRGAGSGGEDDESAGKQLLGMWASGSGSSGFFDGFMDEARVDRTARSPDWIRLCYQNQRPFDEQTLVELPPPVDPPDSIRYPERQPVYYVSQPIAANNPTPYGGDDVDGYTVSPALPAGLSINASTGSITGTPTAATAQADYVVTATNAGGTARDTLRITVVQQGQITNPIVVRGSFVDSAHVKITLSSYSTLPASDPDHVDSVGLWYGAAGYPSAPLLWSSAALEKYSLAQLNAAGTSFVDTIIVTPPLYGPSAYYYFIGAPRWRRVLGNDTIPPSADPTTKGAQVLMYDQAPVGNGLVIAGLSYVQPDTLVISISNTPSIDTAKVESVLVWYSLVDTTHYDATTGGVRWYHDTLVTKNEPFTVRIADAQFGGQSKDVFVAVGLKGTNGLMSAFKKDTATVGMPIPENPIRLRADTVMAQGALLSWSKKDSVRIWYGTVEVPVGANFDTKPFVEINPAAAESTLTILTLNQQTTYWFGLQRFSAGLWSAVTDSSRISITTPVLSVADSMPNRVGIDSAWHDPLTNEIAVSFHVDTAGGLSSAQLQVGIAYSLETYPAKTAIGQVIELVGTDSSVVVKLTESLVFDTTYYVGLFIRDFGRTDWAGLTDSSRRAVTVSQFQWEKITYLLQGDSSVAAFNGNVVLTWKAGFGEGVTDTIRVYEPASLPPGFVAVGTVSVEFAQKLQSAPFTIGIVFDTTRAGGAARMYRDSAGVITVAYGSRVSGDTVWLTTNDVSLPFLVLADTLRPTVRFSADTDTGAVVPDGSAVGMTFTVSDNVWNARWTLQYGRGNMGYEGAMADTLDSLSHTFVKVIPASMTNAAYGLRAILVVCDGGRCDTIDISRRVKNENIDELVTPSRRWVPLRVAAEVNDTSADSCLADLFARLGAGKYDSKRFRLYRWFPFSGNAGSATKWLEYADSIKQIFSFVPGRVMWLKTAVQQGIRFGDGASTSLKQPYGMTLGAKNWSDISLPFKFAVRLSDILAATGPGADSLQFCKWEKTATEKADSTSYVVLDVYAPGLQGHNTAGDTLVHEPLNDAYCVYNPSSSDIVLKVPPNPVAMPALSKASRALAKRASSFDGWSVVLESESGVPLNTVQLGVAHTGAGDVTYYPERPRLESAGIGVVESSTRRVYGHATVWGPGGNGAGFEVAFVNDGTEKREITVRPRVVGAFPDAYAVRLYEAERAAYVAQSARYTVGVGPGGRAYRWVVAGDQAFCDHFLETFKIFKFAILGVRPNPFSQRVFLRYSLPYRDLRNVDFTIYDLQGRTVWSRRLTGPHIRPGIAELVWDGSNVRGQHTASGMFILRMTARPRDSKKNLVSQVRITRMP